MPRPARSPTKDSAVKTKGTHNRKVDKQHKNDRQQNTHGQTLDNNYTLTEFRVLRISPRGSELAEVKNCEEYSSREQASMLITMRRKSRQSDPLACQNNALRQTPVCSGLYRVSRVE